MKLFCVIGFVDYEGDDGDTLQIFSSQLAAENYISDKEAELNSAPDYVDGFKLIERELDVIAHYLICDYQIKRRN
jgi:hypothetical protein